MVNIDYLAIILMIMCGFLVIGVCIALYDVIKLIYKFIRYIEKYLFGKYINNSNQNYIINI